MARAAVDFDDEAGLLIRLRDGDEEAFASLVDQHSPALLRLAALYVSTRATAEDVVQETWVGVIGGLDRFEGRSSIKTWIYRILMNIARTRGASEARVVPFSSAPSVLEEDDRPAFDPERFRPATDAEWPRHWASFPPAWETQPEGRLLAGETLELVKRSAAELPAAQREVTTLRDIEGLSAAETCAVLGISDANQRVLLHRGRSRLREALERYFAAEGS